MLDVLRNQYKDGAGAGRATSPTRTTLAEAGSAASSRPATPGEEAVPSDFDLGKLRSALQREPLKEGQLAAVLVLPGIFSPVCPGHLAVLGQAMSRLETAGFRVLAGWLAPIQDEAVAVRAGAKLAQGVVIPVLRADFRMRLAEQLLDGSSLWSVTPWQASQPGPDVSYVALAGALRSKLLRELSAEEASTIKVVVVAGSSHEKDCKELPSNSTQGLVLVPQNDDYACLLERPLMLRFVAEPGPSRDVSSSSLMTRLRRRDPSALAELGDLASPLLSGCAGEADYDAITTFLTEVPGTAPIGKFARRCLTAGNADVTVMVADFPMSQLQPGNGAIEILSAAKSCLEEHGHVILGAWIAPAGRLPTDVASPSSLGMCRGDDFVELAPVGWSDLTLVELLKKAQIEVKDQLGSLFSGFVKAIYVCSVAQCMVLDLHGIMSPLESILNHGAVIVPQEGDLEYENPPTANPRRLIYLTPKLMQSPSAETKSEEAGTRSASRASVGGSKAEEIRNIFVRADKGGDGYISQDNLMFILRKVARGVLSDHELDVLIKASSVEKDGRIRYLKFVDDIYANASTRACEPPPKEECLRSGRAPLVRAALTRPKSRQAPQEAASPVQEAPPPAQEAPAEVQCPEFVPLPSWRYSPSYDI